MRWLFLLSLVSCSRQFLRYTAQPIPDSVGPVVTFTTLQDGDRVQGVISVEVSAVDADSGVNNVDFTADTGSHLGTAFAPPFALQLDTTKLSDGTHTLTATATDSSEAANRGAASVTVVVANVSPRITGLQVTPAIARAGARLAIAFHVDQPGTTSVTVGAQTAVIDGDGSAHYDVTGSETEGATTVTVSSTDAVALTAMAATGIILDFTAPVLGAVAPTHTDTGERVTPTFDVAMAATDANGIVGCERCMAASGATCTWQPAALAANGCAADMLSCAADELFTLSLRATDTAGNVATSAAVTRLCGGNGPLPGVLTLSPSDKGVVSGTYSFSDTFFDTGGIPTTSCQLCLSSACTGALWNGTTCDSGPQTCSDGQVLTVNMQATNALATQAATPIDITCDTQGPLVGPPLPTSAFFQPALHLSAVASDTPAGLQGCDACVSTDGVCDTEWISVPSCAIDVLACNDGDTETFQFRATDNVGNSAYGPSSSSVCDLFPPDAVTGATVTARTNTSLSLQWSPAQALLAPVTSLRLDLIGASGGSIGPLPPAATTQLLIGLLACQAYSVLVTAFDLLGRPSAPGTLASATTFCGGDFGFAAGVNSTSTSYVSPIEVKTGRLNRDHYPDLLIVDHGDANYFVMTQRLTLGHPNGTFTSNPGHGDGILEDVELDDWSMDGNADYLVSCTQPVGKQLQILRGDNNGRTNQQYYLDVTGSSGNTTSAAAGFADADNISDVFFTRANGQVGVLLGTGFGSFGNVQMTTATSYLQSTALGHAVRGLRVFDFDGDRIDDVIYLDPTNAKVVRYKGGGSNGHGNFTYTEKLPQLGTDSDPESLVVADFNGDGARDFAVTCRGSNQIDVFIANIVGGYPDGTFTVLSGAGAYSTGTQPSGIAAADFDGDRILDLAVSNAGSDSVSLYKGTGSSTAPFVFESSVAAPIAPASIASADFDRNGIADLVVLGNGDVAQIYNGTGRTVAPSGSFDAGQVLATAGTGASIVAADFNGDRALDLAIAMPAQNKVQVLLAELISGRPTGNFIAQTAMTVAGSPTQLAVTDIDANNVPDLFVATPGVAGATLLKGNGSFGHPNGTFTATGWPADATGYDSIAAGDMSNDGIPDLALLSSGSGKAFFVQAAGSNGRGTGLAAATTQSINVRGVSALAGCTATQVALPDFSHDRTADPVINCGDRLVFWPSWPIAATGATGQYSSSATLSFSGNVMGFGGDMSADGADDIIVASPLGMRVTAIGATIDSTSMRWSKQLFNVAGWAAPSDVGALLLADVTGEGTLDVLVLNTVSNKLSVYLGMPDSLGADRTQFVTTPAQFNVGNAPSALVTGDFNWDNATDVAVLHAGENSVRVLLGHGTPR